RPVQGRVATGGLRQCPPLVEDARDRTGLGRSAAGESRRDDTDTRVAAPCAPEPPLARCVRALLDRLGDSGGPHHEPPDGRRRIEGVTGRRREPWPCLGRQCSCGVAAKLRCNAPELTALPLDLLADPIEADDQRASPGALRRLKPESTRRLGVENLERI